MLRLSPRSASDMSFNALPLSFTIPSEGTSNPPSKCSRVLFPDPERPMIAMRSPARTSKSTPSSTCTGAGPWYVFFKPRHDSTTSLIAQRLGRIGARSAPARIERGEERQHERDDADDRHVAQLHVRGQVRDVVDVLGEELEAEQVLDEGHHGGDVE